MRINNNWLSVLMPYARLRIETDLPTEEVYQRLSDETLSAMRRRHPISSGRKKSRKKTPFYDYPFIRVFFAYRDYNFDVDRNTNSFYITDYISDRFPYHQFLQQLSTIGKVLPNTHGCSVEVKMRTNYTSLVFILLLIVCSVLSSQFLFLPQGLFIPWQLPVIYYCVLLVSFQIKVKRLSIFLHELLAL